MSRHFIKKKSAVQRSQFFTLQPPLKGSAPIAIRYLPNTESTSQIRPLIVFFAGFGEQSEEALQDASRPFVQRGFSTVAAAIPFHKMSSDVASWLINDGLRDFLKYIAPSKPFILMGTSRGAAIAASSTKFMDNCTGLILILPLGLSRLTTKEYIRRAFGIT